MVGITKGQSAAGGNIRSDVLSKGIERQVVVRSKFNQTLRIVILN